MVAYAWALARVAGAFADAPPADADAAVVLGAAVWPEGPSPALQRRLRAVLAVYLAGRVRYAVTTGGPGRHPPAEGDASRAWLVARGVPPADIVVENRSHTTWQNLAMAAPAMRARGTRRVMVVSDGYHLARGVRMARDLGFEAWGVSADGPPRGVIARDPARWFGEATLYLAYSLGGGRNP
ncbi:MAG: YdcF family protein [Deltaproteobacteria bacterium]